MTVVCSTVAIICRAVYPWLPYYETAAFAEGMARRVPLRVDGRCGPKFPQYDPPGVFDAEAVPLSDVADTRIAESVAAHRRFVAEHGSLPTAESWTEAAMQPSEKTIRRRFGSFREAIQRAALT